MPDTPIYFKTRKGVEEIAHRSHHLPSRLRTTLIQIDGHRSWSEISQGLMLGERGEEALAQLLNDGYVAATEDEPVTEMEM